MGNNENPDPAVIGKVTTSILSGSQQCYNNQHGGKAGEFLNSTHKNMSTIDDGLYPSSMKLESALDTLRSLKNQKKKKKLNLI
jgi:hypothetical protein